MDSDHSHSPSSHSQHHPHSSLYRVPSSQVALKSPSAWPSPHPCLPGLLPPGMDPASVDFRTFYPYIPNEVKHRKRTTRQQLKVLEELFGRDTKPNAALRKTLAAELDMTPRGVQVWFQNRRAKEKALSKKIVATTKKESSSDLGSNTSTEELSPKEGTPHSSTATEVAPGASPESVPPDSSPSPQPSPLGDTSAQLGPASSPTSYIDIPITPPSVPGLAVRHLQADDAQLVALRRGSLPTLACPQPSHASAYGPPSVDTLDPLSRRRSVDTSLHRLASHPYAHLAMAKNGALYGSPVRAPRSAGASNTLHPPGRVSGSYPTQQARPDLSHRASMPHGLFAVDARQRSSWDLHPPLSSSGRIGTRLSPSPPRISQSTQISRASLPDSRLYAVTSRQLSSPIPGPLPSPNFSFGAPSVSPPNGSPENERDSPDHLSGLPSFTFSRRAEEIDTEDDATSASYDAFSRFGSIASMAGSESSATSAYYSEIAEHDLGAGYDPHVRRGSCASGRFLELMSGLDVNGSAGTGHSTSGLPVNDPYSSQENLPGESVPCMQTDQGSFPSPSSTASPGDSPPPSARVAMQEKSELAYALQGTQEQMMDSHSGYTLSGSEPIATSVDVSNSADQCITFAYTASPNDASSVYPQSTSNSSSSSSLNLSILPEIPEKYHFEVAVDQISADGNYQVAHTYSSVTDGHYSVHGAYSTAGGDGQEVLELHHAMEYAYCPPPETDVYLPYAATSSNVSTMGSTFQHDHPAVDAFISYT